MYKKYIIKRGKKIGPYYYTSKRINGKVRTVYLGSNPFGTTLLGKALTKKSVNGKEPSKFIKPKLKPESKIPKIKETIIGVDKGEFNREIDKLQDSLNFEKRGSGFNKILVLIVIALILITGGVFLWNYNGITGFAVKENSYSENLNLFVNESSNYTWVPENKGELKSLSISGEIIGEGIVRIYLEDFEHLIYSNEEGFSIMKEITGMSVSETGANVQPINESENISNAREAVEIVNESVDNVSLLENLTETIENLTEIVENASFNESLEEVISEKVKKFNDRCSATCNLKEFNKENYSLIILVESASLNLTSVNYEIEVREKKAEEGIVILNKNGVKINYTKIEFGAVTTIKINDFIDRLEFNKLENEEIKVKEIKSIIAPENVSFSKIYSYELSKTNFSSGYLYGNLSSGKLYECKNFEFELDLCLSNWKEIKNITGEYSVELEKKAKGYAETIEIKGLEKENISKLNINLITQNKEVLKNEFFNFTIEVSCEDENGCGDVNLTLDPNPFLEKALTEKENINENKKENGFQNLVNEPDELTPKSCVRKDKLIYKSFEKIKKENGFLRLVIAPERSKSSWTKILEDKLIYKSFEKIKKENGSLSLIINPTKSSDLQDIYYLDKELYKVFGLSYWIKAGSLSLVIALDLRSSIFSKIRGFKFLSPRTGIPAPAVYNLLKKPFLQQVSAAEVNAGEKEDYLNTKNQENKKIKSLNQIEDVLAYLIKEYNEVYKSFDKIKKERGSQNQVNDPKKDFSRSNTFYMYKLIYKSFYKLFEKRSWVGRIRLMRLPEKQLSSRSSGFKSLAPLELRVPGPALNLKDKLAFLKKPLLQAVSAAEINAGEKEDYFSKNISTNSVVLYTFISPCFLKSLSSDHNAEPSFKANAKYGTSFLCGANFSAFDWISGGNLSIGNISILSLIISNASIISDSETLHIFAIVPTFLLNSSIKYDEETSFKLSSKNIELVLTLPIMAANKAVASTTNSIYFSSLNLFATASEILSVNSLATLSDILILDESLLSCFNFSALSNIAFLAISDQSNLNSCMVFSNSSGSVIVKAPILDSLDMENDKQTYKTFDFKDKLAFLKKPFLQEVSAAEVNFTDTNIAKGVISTREGEKPFYTINENPQTCFNLSKGEICTINWEVNATALGEYEFFVIGDYLDERVESSRVNIGVNERIENVSNLTLNFSYEAKEGFGLGEIRTGNWHIRKSGLMKYAEIEALDKVKAGENRFRIKFNKEFVDELEDSIKNNYDMNEFCKSKDIEEECGKVKSLNELKKLPVKGKNVEVNKNEIEIKQEEFGISSEEELIVNLTEKGVSEGVAFSIGYATALIEEEAYWELHNKNNHWYISKSGFWLLNNLSDTWVNGTGVYHFSDKDVDTESCLWEWSNSSSEELIELSGSCEKDGKLLDMVWSLNENDTEVKIEFKNANSYTIKQYNIQIKEGKPENDFIILDNETRELSEEGEVIYDNLNKKEFYLQNFEGFGGGMDFIYTSWESENYKVNVSKQNWHNAEVSLELYDNGVWYWVDQLTDDSLTMGTDPINEGGVSEADMQHDAGKTSAVFYVHAKNTSTAFNTSCNGGAKFRVAGRRWTGARGTYANNSNGYEITFTEPSGNPVPSNQHMFFKLVACTGSGGSTYTIRTGCGAGSGTCTLDNVDTLAVNAPPNNAPIVQIDFPKNNTLTASHKINYTYNVTDTDSNNNGVISNCSLFLFKNNKWEFNKTNTSRITEVSNMTINITMKSETVKWKVGCYDKGSKQGNSSAYNITVYSLTQYCGGSYNITNGNIANWNINNDVVCGNETIPVSGNISINTGGNLTLYNVTINFSMLKNGSNFINKTEQGGLWIFDNFRNGTGDEGDASWITGNDSEFYYDFYVFGKGKNGNFSMMHSKVTQAGYTTKSQGIYLRKVNNSVIYKNNISDTARFGLYLVTSGKNNISKNFVNTTGSDGYGIWLLSSSKLNTLQSNTITTTGSGGYGIILDSSSNSNISSNTITTTGSGGRGIYLFSSSNSNITSNTITTTRSDGYGIFLTSSSNSNTLQSNTINTTGSSGWGIYLSLSSNSNTLQSNTITTNGSAGYGIYLDGDLAGNENNTLQSNTITTTGSRSYGIYLSASSKNNATKNKINATGSNADGIFINHNSDNNIIYKNNITESGRYGVNIDPLGANKPTNNNITKNLIFNSTMDGIAVSEQKNIIEYNFINWSKGYGINISHKNINVTGNTIVNGSSYGIYVNDSNAIIYRNKIEKNAKYGIFAAKTNNTNISKNMIRKNTGYDVFVENSTDFILDDNSSSLALNTSFYKVKIRNFGNLTVQYYMRVNVTDDSALELNNINITARYTTTSYNWSKLSVNGYTNWYIQNAYVRNSSNNVNRTNYNPYNISGWRTGYRNNESRFSLLVSRTIWLTLPAIVTNYCGGSYQDYGGSVDNWNINTNIVCGNETIPVDGNISVNSGGNLTLRNVTINFSMLKNGSNFINKTKDGGLWIFDNFRNGTGDEGDASWITGNDSEMYYDFWINGYGKNDNFSLMHSKITQSGYSKNCAELSDASSCSFFKCTWVGFCGGTGIRSGGLQIYNISNAMIYKNNISDGAYYGLYLIGSRQNNISKNFVNTTGSSGYGIYLLSSSNSNTLQSNTITTTGSDSYGIYLDTVSNSNSITSNIITIAGTSSNYGIYFVASSNSNLSSNTITTTGIDGVGIYLLSSSNSNILQSNTIKIKGSSGYGIYLNGIVGSNINNNLSSNTITTNGSSGYGIYLFSSSKNNATKNKINATGSNADGVFIYQDSDNNIISKNNITESGRYGVNIDPSGANKPTNNNITKNIIFNSTFDGIAVSEQKNIIEYNIINRSRNYGINVSHSKINITGNIIYNSTSYGIYVNSSNTLILRNTIRNTTGAGIYLGWKSKNSRIILNNITRNFVGVNITNATGINLTNNSFIQNTIYDIELSASSSAISLNNSLNKKKVKVNASGGKYSNLSMKWFLYVNATDNKTNPSGLNNVNVTIYDNSTGNLNAIMLSRQTNSRGRTALFEIKEYIQNSSGNLTTYMPVNVSGVGNASYYTNRTKKFFGRSLPLFSLTLGTKPPTVLGSYCSGSYVDYDGSVDNWNINTNVVCGNETIPVSGNISVNSGGNLTLYNVTINFSMLKNGSNFINKTEQGGLWIFDNFRNGTGDEGDASWITGNDSEMYYDFYVFGKGKNGNFSMMHSKVTQAGYTTKSQGIYLRKVNNSVIYKNNISNGARYGLYLDRSRQNNISKNFINTTGSSGYGIYLFDSSNSNTLKGNTITTKGSTGFGIYLFDSSNSNTLQSNTITTNGSSGYGILLDSSSNLNTLQSNRITTKGSFGYGIFLATSSNSNITSNTITTTGSDGRGIFLSLSSNSNTLQSNTITTNGSDGFGIYLFESSNSNITSNTIKTNGSSGYGISLGSSSNSNITSNTITTNGSTGYGIYLLSSSNSNTLQSNRITTKGSSGQGIYLYSNSNSNTLQSNTIKTNGSSGYGIYLDSSSKNNATKNKINATGSNADGVFIYGNSDNNIIYKNNITESGRNGVNIDPAGSAKPTNNNITKNIIFNSTLDGIAVSHSDNIIEYNLINRSRQYGINVSHKDINITGNIIYNSTNYGIYVNSSNTLILRNTIRNTTGAGIYLGWKSKNSRIILNNITRNFVGVNITNATGINLTNNSFIGNTIYDIELSATSSAISLNNSLNKKKVKVNASGGKYSNLSMKWFLYVNVSDNKTNPSGLNNVNVTIYDNSTGNLNAIMLSRQTNSRGRTALFEIKEYIQNSSGNLTTYMPVNVSGVGNASYYANRTKKFFGRSLPLFSLTLRNSPPAVTASYCNGNYIDYTNSLDNWNINSNIVCGNETIPVDGNISINTGGNLTLRNVTINFSMLKDGSNFINKTKNGGLWIYDNFRNGTGNEEDGSLIASNDSKFEYDFWVYGYGKNDNFSMRHSKVRDAGYSSTGTSRGIQLYNISNVIIYQNNISDGANYGLYLQGSRKNNISNNTVKPGVTSGSYGIYLDSSSNSNTTSNTITTTGTSGYGIYLFGTSNSNTLQSNIIRTTGSSGLGISLASSSNSNTLQSNTITTTGTSGYGIYLSTGSNSNITSNIITTKGSSGFGIYLFSSSKNNATKNKINATGSNADGVFIYQNSDNNIINKNNITESGRNGVNIDTSGFSKPTNNNITKNIIFNSTKDGIAVSHSDNIIEYNIINRSRQYGVNVSHKDINITGNIIYNSTSYGIYVNSSNTLILRNTIRNTTGAGIYLGWKSRNTRIILNNITRNFVGVNITNATGINLTNNSFIQNTIYDIELSASSSAISLNNSLNKKKVKVNASGGKYSNLSMKWFLQVKAIDNTSTALNNINISVYYNDSKTSPSTQLWKAWFGANTTSAGVIKIREITEFIQNSSGNDTDFMPLNITAEDAQNYDPNYTAIEWFGRSMPVYPVTLQNLGGGEANQAPIIRAVNITSNTSIAYTNTTLNCTFNVTDASASFWANVTWWNGTVNWNGDDQLKTPLTTGQNKTTNQTGNLEGSDISKNEVWKCEVRVWDSGGLVKRMNSTTITIKNTKPHNNITLLAPSNTSSATNRTPLYTWTRAYDIDKDVIYYNITIDDAKQFTSPELNTTSAANKANYTVKDALKVDTKLYWRVRAFDGSNYTRWSGLFEHTINSVVSLTLINDSVEFGSVASGAIADTMDNIPAPFWMQNEGNVFVNVSVNATQQLWKAKALGTKYFQYNVSRTNESNSYSNAMSNRTKWQNLSSIAGFAVALLNYSAKTDSVALNIRIEVPPSEPAGFKQSNLTFIAELTSLTKR